MVTRATHTGECQLCGKVQLLPNNRLSIHGYTVQWNMFVGDCSGSKRLPYELSCDDLKSSLINTSLRIEEAKKEISDLSMRTGNICYFRVYQDGYYWVEVEILANDSGRVGYTYAGKSSFNTVIPYFLTTEEVARHYDDEYVKQVLRPNLAALQYYKKWCEDRIENWILKPLTPR